MADKDTRTGVDRRDFFKSAAAGLTAAGVALAPHEASAAGALAQLSEKGKFERIASCTWPIRPLFKTRQGGGRGPAAGAAGGRGNAPAAGATGAAGAPAAVGSTPDPAAAQQAAGGRGGQGGRGGGRGTGAPMTGPEGATSTTVQVPPVPANRDNTSTAQMKAKYGEITMLDFPQWTKDNFPGVFKMDLFSGLMGDVTDDTMFFAQGSPLGSGFDPMSPSGRKWLEQLGNILVKTGTRIQHISNNAPFGLADSGSPEADARRKAGVAMAKRWLEGFKDLGVVSMRMNSVTALGPQIRPNAIPRSGDGYPRNLEIVPLLDAAIESYKEMADFGGSVGIKATFENHWGLAADPMNLRIMIDAVNHPYCDATPDFCNWEHDYMLFNGLKALAPYSTSNVHAKYWDRWGDKNDVQRSARIMLAGGFKGTFALEYEAGPLNGVEGAKYLYKEVLAALTSPTPVT